MLCSPLQRHQERWCAVARSHEEDSIQHSGLEGPDQFTQRVCCVIRSFTANLNALTGPYYFTDGDRRIEIRDDHMRVVVMMMMLLRLYFGGVWYD